MGFSTLTGLNSMIDVVIRSLVFSVSYLMGGVLNGVEPSMAELRRNSSPIYLWLVWPSYARWAAEAMTLGEYRNLNQFKVKEAKDLTRDRGYRQENWFYGLLFLYISGAVYRLLAYFFFQRRMKL